MHKKGFTLIELLVVIGIIAILAAIIFPVFSKAREKSRQVTCLSNLSQISKAMMIYEDLFYRRDFVGEDAFKERVMSLLNGDELEGGYRLRLINYLKEYSPVTSYEEARNHMVVWLLSQKYSSEYRRPPSIPVYIALYRDIWDRIVKNQKEIKKEADDLARKYFPKIEPEYNINKIDFKKIEQEELSNFEKYPDSRPTSKATTPPPDATTTP